MFKTVRDPISERRFLLQNPYAHIEDLEARQIDLDDHKQSHSLATAISSSRELLQNPYAYLDGAGNFSAQAKPNSNKLVEGNARKAFTNRNSTSVSITRSYFEIEAKVKDIHELIWRNKDSIWIGAVPVDPVDMLDPAVALKLIGYEYQLADGLGQYQSAGGLLEVAGLIDHSSKTVQISRQFPSNVCAFTAAHELGHAILHPSATGVHRDRPLNGATLSRERSEIEADKFATFFLMPARLVRSRFAGIFGAEVFFLDEDTSFALAGVSHSELKKKCKTIRDLSRLLASTGRYDGMQFPSLADQFRVSIETMAIRIEELALLSLD